MCCRNKQLPIVLLLSHYLSLALAWHTHQYKVKVNIPREFSANQNVVIVGEPRDIERANTYIEKAVLHLSLIVASRRNQRYI